MPNLKINNTTYSGVNEVHIPLTTGNGKGEFAYISSEVPQIKANGIHDVKHYGSVSVDVPSEEPSIEPLTITENGTYSPPSGIHGYAPVVVKVPIPDNYIIPSGTLTIRNNGTHNVTQYASVNVNVPASGVQLPNLTNPGTASDMLSGKQLIDENGNVVTGNIANRGAMNRIVDGINTTSVSVNAGYYSGGSVTFDSSAIEALLDAL